MPPADETRPLRDRRHLRVVLIVTLDRLDARATGLQYRLVGTGAALMMGVELPASDVDILLARREDVDRFAATLARYEHRCLQPPTWLPDARQYFTQFEVDGVGVGASTVEVATDADTFECIGRGPWEHFRYKGLGQHAVPVVALELRLVSELVRDRPDRYGPIIEHLRAHGADLDLVRRAMVDRDVEPQRQQYVIDQLTSPFPVDE
jgi:hypothetical protein